MPNHLVIHLCFIFHAMKQDRRRIESEFFSGKLCGIAATNALELGIDVGHIDVTLHLGFPGSVARYSVALSQLNLIKLSFFILCSHQFYMHVIQPLATGW